MGIVIVLDLVVGNDDGGIDGIKEGNHDEVNVGGLIVLGDGAAEHQRVLVGAGVEEGAVLLVELLGIDGVLKIVPVKLVVVVGVHKPDEINDHVGGEVTVAIKEHCVLGNDRGRIGSGGKVEHLGLADGDTGILGFLDEKELVDERLPGGVPDLGLLLLGRGGGTGHELVESGETLDILLEISVGNGLSIDPADIVFG